MISKTKYVQIVGIPQPTGLLRLHVASSECAKVRNSQCALAVSNVAKRRRKMGESKRRKLYLVKGGPMADTIPVTCSKCQALQPGIPGVEHEGCGGRFFPAAMAGGPRQFKFSGPEAMMLFMLLDRMVGDAETCTNQMVFMGQDINKSKLAQTIKGIALSLVNIREAFYKADQGGIVIVGPNGTPH